MASTRAVQPLCIEAEQRQDPACEVQSNSPRRAFAFGALLGGLAYACVAAVVLFNTDAADVPSSSYGKLMAGLPPMARVPLSAEDEAGRVADHVVQTAKARMTDTTLEARMAGFDVQAAAAVVDPRGGAHARMLEDMRAMAGDPELQREAQGFAVRAGAMMADPRFEAQAALMASQVRTLVAAPGFLEEATRAESEVQSFLAQQPHVPRSALAAKFFTFNPLLPAQTTGGLQSAEAAVQPALPGGQVQLAAGRAALRRSNVVMAASGATSLGGARTPETDTEKMLQQIKDSGIAGIISYALWEGVFWGVSIPVCIGGYYQVTGHLPDLTNGDDVKQLGAEAFAFVNVARFAVPARVGLALGMTPWVKENIVEKFGIGGANKIAVAAEPVREMKLEEKTTALAIESWPAPTWEPTRSPVAPMKETPKPTEAPTTETPKPTAAPTTEAPKPTEAPTTEAPKPTLAPTTEAPTTEAPKSTAAPTTEAPEPTEAPKEQKPADEPKPAEEEGTQPSPPAKLELPDAKLNAAKVNQEQWGIGGAQEKPAEEKPGEGTQPSPPAELELPDAKLNAAKVNQEQWGIGGAQGKPAEEKPGEGEPTEETTTPAARRVRKRDIVRKILFPWNWNKKLSELDK